MSDILSNPSRNFYERTKGKLALSLLVASTGLMLLGFCAYSGGMSRSLQIQYQALDNKNLNDDFQATSYYQMHAGYAFAAFAYILGALLLIIGAIYISPLICGSANERMMLKSPSEIDGGYASNNRNEPRTQI